MTADHPQESVRLLAGHTSEIRNLVFHPRLPLLVSSAMNEGVIRVWDLASTDLTASSVLLRGHAAEVTIMAFANDGRLFSGDQSGNLRAWNEADLRGPSWLADRDGGNTMQITLTR